MTLSDVAGPLYAVLVDRNGREVSGRVPMSDAGSVSLVAADVAARAIVRTVDTHVDLAWVNPPVVLNGGDSFEFGPMDFTFA